MSIDVFEWAFKILYDPRAVIIRFLCQIMSLTLFSTRFMPKQQNPHTVIQFPRI